MREGRKQSPLSAERPPINIEKREQELNEVIPMLAHGLVRRLERKGLSGKVRVRAAAGNDWGVAVSPENPAKDVPDVIVYPREYLSKDKKLVNARLRHEVGNLNYPIEEGLNELRAWCEERGIAPALVTPLAQAVHEASVNYLEMQNAFSAHPEENFKALYEQEVDTARMAEQLKEASPYKQAVTLTLLYSLSQTGIIPKEHFNQGLANARTEVRDLFDARTKSVIDQAVKMAAPQKQVHLIREHLWPKFAQFATSADVPEKSDTPQVEVKQEGSTDLAGLTQMEKMHREVEEMREKIRQAYKERAEKKSAQKQKSEQQAKLPKQELSPAEQKERRQTQDLLEQALTDQLQNIQEELSKAQKQAGTEATPQMPQPQTMEELAKQAEQLREQMETLQEAAKEDQALNEQLEALQEQAEQIKDIAEYVAEPEKKLELEEEPMTYNIREYGINELKLTEEQKEILKKVRQFSQETSKVYRGVMRLLMDAYQQRNPNFTDKIITEIKEKGYDLPAFSLYGKQAGENFLQSNEELRMKELSGDGFLVNFNLPKPFGRFWYKGGQGSKSVPVKEGGIEWGEFYRRSMPVVWSAVDRAMMQGLYLQRLNEFSQHDYKKYYYLWEAMGLEFPESAQEEIEQAAKEQEDKESAESAESGEAGAEGEREAGEGVQGAVAEAGEGVGEQAGAESGNGMPSAQEMQEFLNQMQESLQQAMEQGDMPGRQAATQEMLNELAQMQDALQSGASPQDMAGQLSDMMGELSRIMEGMESGVQGEAEEGEIGEQPHDDEWQKGDESNVREMERLFSNPSPELLRELRQLEALVESKFESRDEEGNVRLKEVDEETRRSIQEKAPVPDQAKQKKQLATLEALKEQQQRRLEQMYREMSGLEGEALRVYMEYMEYMKDFIEDLKEFFIERFKLDQDYRYEKHQRRGARLERGWQRNIVGMKDRKPVLRPESFERKRPPEKPQFAWTLIIDNSGSCSGEIIEQEKRLAVALIEVAKELDIPFEIMTFGGPENYTFLKNFEQDVKGGDLQKTVLLNADQGTPDVETLEAAAESMRRFTDKFKRSYNFVYFMTDGQSGSGSIQEVIEKYKRDMVITGIGLAGAAKTIKVTWGKNALEVPEVRKLSEKFIRKIEEQIEQTFD
jgi:chemotaxis protein histidine kinase CheA